MKPITPGVPQAPAALNANPLANHDAAATSLKPPTTTAPANPAKASPAVPGFLQQGLSAMKGFLPWKQIMDYGGLPAVAGIGGMMEGRNNFAPFFEQQKAAQAFGGRLGVESKKGS